MPFPKLDLKKVRILQVTLVLVSLAFALWAYSRWLPAPVKLTEEKAIDQSPLSRLVDVEVQADAARPRQRKVTEYDAKQRQTHPIYIN